MVISHHGAAVTSARQETHGAMSTQMDTVRGLRQGSGRFASEGGA